MTSKKMSGRIGGPGRFQRVLGTPFLSLIVATAVEPANPLEAQAVIAIPSAPSCESCRIYFDTIAVLGDTDGPGMVQEQARIQMGPDSRFFVTSGWEPGIIKVFDQNGRYLTRFGRQGEGPGEYGLPQVYPGENVVHVFDPVLGRVTALTPNFEIIATRRLPFGPSGAARIDSNRFLLHGGATTAQHIGIPLHVYDDQTGTIVRSFGAISERVTPWERGSTERRTVAVAADGTIWSAEWNRYRIERWDPTNGQLVAVFERKTEWFPGFDRPPPGTVLTRPPSTVLWRMSGDGEGRLWVLIHVASETWQPQAPAAADQQHTYISDAQYNRLHDSVLEVLSPGGDEPRLLTSGRFRGRIMGFAAERIVYVYDEDEIGNPRYLIMRLQIRS